MMQSKILHEHYFVKKLSMFSPPSLRLRFCQAADSKMAVAKQTMLPASRQTRTGWRSIIVASLSHQQPVRIREQPHLTSRIGSLTCPFVGQTGRFDPLEG